MGFAARAFRAAGVFAILPYSRTSLFAPASASATAIVSLCTSRPTYVIDLSMTRLLCMRLGAGTPGATLDKPAYCENGSPYLRRTCGLEQAASKLNREGILESALF
jgi:hypothetical protein